MADAACCDTHMAVAEFRPRAEPRRDKERWEVVNSASMLKSPRSAHHQCIVSNPFGRLSELAECRGCNTPPGLGVPSKRTFLILSQDEVRAEALHRTEAVDRVLEALGRDHSLILPELGGAVPISAVYTGLSL